MSRTLPKNGIPISKRILDLTLTLLGMVVALPIMAVVACVVWFKGGAPVIFSQERPGYRGKLFRLYKFRTMADMRDGDGQLLPDELRLERWGQVLRSTSLDELPELFNVLKGEMSLVGPRPLLARYLSLYSPEQARRHDAAPGITGWAQVNGRNALAWEDKFKLDVWYVDHWSFWLDLKILAQTVLKVFRREDITQVGQATAEEFTGSPPAQIQPGQVPDKPPTP
jgi:lipopolysaccharide/colanic/teichoic acid biosynthesis glycosyltransferase